MLKPIMDDYFSGAKAARKFLADLLSDIDMTLSPDMATLTSDDRHRLIGAKVQIPPAFEEIVKVIDSLPTGSPTIRTAYICLHQLMLGAFHAGAFCVVSDSARDYLRRPLTEGGSKGGRKSGQSRRAARPWVPHATELILASRKTNPGWSYDDIAADVEASWKLQEIHAPGHQTLKNHIGEMIAAGDIPPRQVTKRLHQAK